MVKFILRKTKGDRHKIGVASGIFGIFANLSLTALKFVAGIMVGSVAVMADAFNNLTDSITSIATIFGFKMSTKPADKEHPFGHGRIEDVVGLIVAVSIVFVGLEFVRASIANILEPEYMQISWLATALLIASFFIKIWMYVVNKVLGKKIKSNTLAVVATDSRNDVIISIFTLASIAAFYFFDLNVDGYAGLLISLILIVSGVKAIITTASSILGRGVDKETAAALKEIVQAPQGVLGVHDLIIHSYGPQKLVATIHIEVDADTPLRACHDMADDIEQEVLKKLGIHLTIHIDPIDTKCEQLAALTTITKKFFSENYPQLDAHEFKIAHPNKDDSGACVENCIFTFELQLPHNFPPKALDALSASLEEKIQEINTCTTLKITTEHSYIEEG
ncbi:MAG: cation diffusion facilitator family transporter [Defluviitaleaceae bacterium]|nr:cation diffusion facilitator family transporter [Defluviitaleaceae bacterium]